MSKHYAEQYPVHSFSEEATYKVSLDDYGIYSCSCNGWIFQRGYPHPTEKRPNPAMRALHNGVLRDKADLDRLGISPNGNCKHIMYVLGNRGRIATAVATRGTSRIESNGLYVEVEDGRIISFFQHLGVKTTR